MGYIQAGHTEGDSPVRVEFPDHCSAPDVDQKCWEELGLLVGFSLVTASPNIQNICVVDVAANILSLIVP